MGYDYFLFIIVEFFRKLFISVNISLLGSPISLITLESDLREIITLIFDFLPFLYLHFFIIWIFVSSVFYFCFNKDITYSQASFFLYS